MRIKITKTNSNTNYYVIKDFKINGKRTTKIIEKLGTEDDIKIRFKDNDINNCLKNYINMLNEKENKSKTTIIKCFDTDKLI